MVQNSIFECIKEKVVSLSISFKFSRAEFSYAIYKNKEGGPSFVYMNNQIQNYSIFWIELIPANNLMVENSEIIV